MSSQTDYRRVYEPQSTTFDSYSTVYQSFPHGQDCVIYDDAYSANIPVQPVETEMTSVQNGEERHEQYNIPSMSREQYRSMYQPTDDTGSIDHALNSRCWNPSLQSYEEQLRLQSLQKQGTMESYRRQVVMPNSGKMLLQQPHESLPNTSLQGEPPGSLPNISVENNSSLASQYPSYNHHANQSSSHSQSHKVVFPNRSGMIGEVNQSGYQRQSGQPNFGANQYASQEQGAKVVLPNRSVVLGEANHNVYQNQAGRVNESIRINQNASQYHPNKVVLPNHSAVLGEANHNIYQNQAGRVNDSSRINQNASQEQAAKVVLPNHSAVLANHVYQNQTGRPNESIGINQSASQYHPNKVILPNHSAVLGETDHDIYLNQTGRPNGSIGINQNASQYHPNKVVLPNHSAVLAERNQNLPLDAQHQSNFSLTRSRPTFSADQTVPSSQNISLPSNGMEAQPGSVMTQRNRELNMQNQQNITIPPTLVLESGSNYSIYKDQKGEVHGQDQYRPNAVAPPSASVHVLQHQIHPQSQNHAYAESIRIQQHSAGDHKGKKVFILHFIETVGDNPVLKLGEALWRMKVDVTLDLFENDNPPNSWPIWYEQKIKESDVVLCIITENFYYQLTNSNHVLGYSVYNLMNSSRNITFRAVFIDAKKEMEYVPPAMRGATCYSISSNQLTPNDDDFADLYAFLTGQNRIMKPPLGNMITLAPKRSRFGNFAGSSGAPAPAYNNSRNVQQQQQQRVMMHQPMAPQQPPPAVGLSGGVPDVEQANFIFVLLGGDATPIKSVRSHNQMLMQLASKLMAEWEALGRMLSVSEPDIYAIKADNIHSVKEQAVQMFQHWMRKNGSRATLGVLTTAVYDSGPQYWNLLDTINKYAPQQ